jgi:hypothetical protein
MKKIKSKKVKKRVKKSLLKDLKQKKVALYDIGVNNKVRTFLREQTMPLSIEELFIILLEKDKLKKKRIYTKPMIYMSNADTLTISIKIKAQSV